MRTMWMKRALMAAALMALVPACGDAAGDGAKVTESPNLGEKGSVKATAAAGGELALPESGVTLSIPAGALSEDTEITAEIVTKKGLPDGAALAGNVVEFGPDGLTFNMPVGLEIDLAGAKIPDGSEVSIAWLDEDKNEWIDLPGSKMTGSKVTAETTHFTRFAIHFVVNDDGEIVQDGGECNTDGFKACGGKLEGTWDFTVGCATLGKKIGDADDDSGISKCVSADLGVDFSGEVTFEGGKVTGESTSAFDIKASIDKQCLAGVFESMGQSISADDIKCDDFAGNPEPGEAPTKVEDTGDMCVITPPVEAPETDTIDGTYTVDGSTVTITDSDVDAGDTEQPKAQEFCVEGDKLTLVIRNEEDGTVFMITAMRK